MEFHTVLYVLVVYCIFREALTLQRRHVEQIAEVLADVSDWEGLANWLEIGSNDIKTKCAQSNDPGPCYRRSLVRRYCDSQLSENPSKVAEDIAIELEQKMNHKRQAHKLRKLGFDKGRGSHQYIPPDEDRHLVTPPTEEQFGFVEDPHDDGVCQEEECPTNMTIQAQMTTSSNPKVTSSFTIRPSPLTVPHALCAQSSPIPSPCPLTRYADYLRTRYKNDPIAKRDKLPSYRGKVFINLAIIKKEDVSQEAADTLTYHKTQGAIDEILKHKQSIAMEDVMKDNDIRLVLVEGAPGIGKSTFAWELCRQWPILESLKRFSLVVLLKLREERVQTATAISDLFPCADDFDLGRSVGEDVRRRMGEGVLLVFDGFDEFPAELRRKSLVAEVICGSYLPKANVLVTSRPSATAELLSVCQAHVGKHIEILGFSHKDILTYAENILASDLHLLADFQRYLSLNPVVEGMMYNPLSCAIVVDVYLKKHKSNMPIPRTLTQLYTELSLSLLLPHLIAIGHPMAKKLPNRLEDIPHDDNVYLQLVKLGELAFEATMKGEVIFKHLPTGCSDLGLLDKYSTLYGRTEDETYNFFHLTLQEYMGAFYVSQCPASEQRQLFEQHHNKEHLNLTWRFVAGLTRMQTIGLEWFRKETYKKYMYEVWYRSRKYFYSGHEETIVDKWFSIREEDGVVEVLPSVLQLFYEAQDAENCAVVFGQSRVKYHGGWNSTPFDAYAVGYCVSLCNNNWSVDLTRNHFGPEVVERLLHGLKSVQYGCGTVEELSLSGTPIKDEGMKYLEQFPHHILQKMRTLSICNCGLGQRGFDLLSDTVPLLSNLESLDISANPGGNGSTVKLLQALGKHQRVARLSMWSTKLGRGDVTALSKVVHRSGNLRELKIGDFRCMSPECVQQLVRITLSPSSLEKLVLHVCSSVSPLDYIENVSDNLTRLEFREPILCGSCGAPSEQQPTQLGHIKLSNILKENTTLKVLQLFLPLGSTEVRAIVESLKHNHHQTELWLSKRYHFQYFSEAEQQALDDRIKWLR